MVYPNEYSPVELEQETLEQVPPDEKTDEQKLEEAQSRAIIQELTNAFEGWNELLEKVERA